MAVIPLTRMTVADAVRQPLTWLTTAVSLALLGLSFSFGMFNFEAQDRLRMMATAGVAVAVINGLFLVVVGVSQAIHDELASRTALTLFAKPLGRGHYLVGKALGIWLTAAAAGLVIIAAHLALLHAGKTTSFEGLFSAQVLDEGLEVPWQPVLAAHLLAVLHAGVMGCVAAVLALFLPLVANILVCFALFVLGHLIAGLAGAPLYGAVLVPGLALFNVDDAMQVASATQQVPWTYVAWASLYSLLFAAGSLLLGLSLFQRQDIP